MRRAGQSTCSSSQSTAVATLLSLKMVEEEARTDTGTLSEDTLKAIIDGVATKMQEASRTARDSSEDPNCGEFSRGSVSSSNTATAGEFESECEAECVIDPWRFPLHPEGVNFSAGTSPY